jgi:hypothetical protein
VKYIYIYICRYVCVCVCVCVYIYIYIYRCQFRHVMQSDWEFRQFKENWGFSVNLNFGENYSHCAESATYRSTRLSLFCSAKTWPFEILLLTGAKASCEWKIFIFISRPFFYFLNFIVELFVDGLVWWYVFKHNDCCHAEEDKSLNFNFVFWQLWFLCVQGFHIT